MKIVDFIRKNNYYQSPTYKLSLLRTIFPSLYGHSTIVKEIVSCSFAVKQCNPEEALPIILQHTEAIVYGLERVGVPFDIQGIEYTKQEPCIIVANHMSSLETIITTLFAGALYPVSFVSKRSVMSYPFFRVIFSKLYPLLVNRVNPREDFKTVLKEGASILDKGRHLVIFSQGTRSQDCKTEDFSSIGVKLAKHTGYSLLPLALKTDAWRIGRWVKDIGYIDPIPVHYRFFTPIPVTSATGKEEHITCVEQISAQVNKWRWSDVRL